MNKGTYISGFRSLEITDCHACDGHHISCHIHSFVATYDVTDVYFPSVLDAHDHVTFRFQETTRMHSSRMHTACSLTISPSMLCSGGACLVQGGSGSGGVPGLGGCLPGPGGGAWSGECLVPAGCLVPGGACLVPGGGGIPAYTEADPPVDRIFDTCLWKYYFAPNFICGW